MIHRLAGAARGLGVVAGMLGTSGVSLAQCLPAFVPHHVPPLGGKVYAMIQFDDDADGVPSIFAAGDTFSFQGSSLGSVAKLVGETWTRPGSGFSGPGRAMIVREVAGMPQLVVAGGGVQSWNGQTWSSVGGSAPGLVQAMALHDDGSGPTLYIGGMFSTVYRLVGNTWAVVGGTQRLNAGRVQSLVEFDEDGPGGNPPRLFAAGATLGAQNAACLVAKYDGLGWSPVTPTGQSNWIKSMIRHDNGTGPKLYATAHPSGGVGQPFLFNAQIAGYNGQQWTSLITPTTSDGPAYALVSFEEQRGQPRVLWGQTDQHILRAPDTGATTFATVSTMGVDYSQITPLVLPPIGAGPECVLFPTASGAFVKLAGCPRLAADTTLDGILDSNDIFEYLGFWFALNPRADFDHSGGLSTSDIFAFLNAWFAGI